jgi:dipeptidyl aminopeptidase/acylaminoacyl peptidase
MKTLRVLVRVLFLLLLPCLTAQVQSADLFKLHSAGGAQFSPDGKHIAYTVSNSDRPGRPWRQVWIMEVSSGQTSHLGGPDEPSSGPKWSPDGNWIAYHGKQGEKSGLLIAHPDGSGVRFMAETEGTNAPLPNVGSDLSWSPDSKQLAYVTTTPGPETQEASGDPVVIRRYLYKPDYDEGMTRFNDNRRNHIFIADIATGQTRQLTKIDTYEHSIEWSPKGDELVFVSEGEPDADMFYDDDLFTVRLSDGKIRRLTASEGSEFEPHWSPDGTKIAYMATKRGLTDRETNMEDSHLWIMNADGSDRREIGRAIDNRQHSPQWSPDGKSVYVRVQDRGSMKLARWPAAGGEPEVQVSDTGVVTSFSLNQGGDLVYTFASTADASELFLKPASGTVRRLTDVNHDLLSAKQLAAVESFTFISNDFKYNVEAFLTLPLNFDPSKKYPLIVNIHGGPHGQQGPALNFHNQVYATHGFATLMVNYRGSTGYGQKFADAVFRDQDGDEGNDILYGVSAAVRRYPWIDRDRMGIEGVSYGGQLTDWLITQTGMFKAAIPLAGISNLISYNYMTYYNQYEAMEWGAYLHQDDLMNILWERSALKHVAAAHTPTMLLHGENDNDVPIAEAEQFYIALKDVGTEAVLVRYPREGHGLQETRHIVDALDRSLAWYDQHFAHAKATAVIP